MGIKIASRERKLQSPEGSFVSFEKFVFVNLKLLVVRKKLSVCDITAMESHESILRSLCILLAADGAQARVADGGAA